MIKTKFKDLLVIQNKPFKDKRGYFKELIRENTINKKFPFLVMSYSKKNVIRGLHLQSKKSQGKFISVIKGKIFDVAVDLRKNSKTFGKHFAITMNYDSNFSMFIPEGFAHGFACLSKTCTLYYRCTKYRHQKSETTLRWNDPELNIKWGIKNPILSEKDKNGRMFKDIKKDL